MGRRLFTEAMTTRQLMMTIALKELYAFLDIQQVDNDGYIADSFHFQHRDTPIVVEAAQGPIALSQTLDVTSANYMHWYNPDVGADPSQPPGCRHDPAVLASFARALHCLLLGSIDGRTLRTGEFCQLTRGSDLPSDACGKGSVAPILPNAPTLFFATGVESVCQSIAASPIRALPR